MLLTYYNDCNIFLPAVFANKVTLKVRTKGITTRLNKKCWERNIHKKIGHGSYSLPFSVERDPTFNVNCKDVCFTCC
jgi:hypothetical protein